MNSNLLLAPAPKRKPLFQRRYPFPIYQQNEKSPSEEKWQCITAHLKEGHILVSDKESMQMLYSMGFYGKSNLSKAAPKACSVFLDKEKNLNKKKKQEKTTETPKEDDCVAMEQDKQSEKEIQVADCSEPVGKKRKLSREIDVLTNDSLSSDSSSNEDSSVIYAMEEELQLMFEEAFFLSYGLGCLVVKENENALDLIRLWHRLCELSLDKNFPVMYTAYHHFRSKGWIVRSGLKYGADYVLYKDGPPFYHSTYAVIVKAVKENQLKVIDKSRPLTWSSLSALNRINSHAAKGVMLLYIIKPDMISENKISTPFCVSQFKLQEVLLKRWVPSEGREERRPPPPTEKGLHPNNLIFLCRLTVNGLQLQDS